MGSNIGELVAEVGLDTSKMDEGFKSIKGKMAGFGKNMQAVGKGMTGIFTAPILGLGAAAFSAGNSIDEAMKIIQTGTGATGEALAGLEADFKTVFAEVPGDADVVAMAMADLNTLTGLTGEALQEATKTAVELGNSLDADVGGIIQSVGQSMKAFGVDGKEVSSILDLLFTTAQTTGVGVDELANSLKAYGPVTKNLGLSLDETIKLFSDLEGSGLSVSRVMPGLNAFMRKTAGASDSITKALTETTKEMGDNADAVEKNREKHEELSERLEEMSDDTLVKHQKGLEKNRDKYVDMKGKLAILNLKMGEFTEETSAVTKASAEMRKQKLENTIADLNSEYEGLNKSGPKLSRSQRKLVDDIADLNVEFGDLTREGQFLAETFGNQTISQAELAESGIDMRGALGDVLEQIKNAKTETEALNLATDAFGAEGAQRLMLAVRSGAISLESLTESSENSTGAILANADATRTSAEKFALWKNQIMLTLGPLGDQLIGILEQLAPHIEKLIGFLGQAVDWFGQLSDKNKLVILGMAGFLAVIGPLLLIIPFLIAAIVAISFPVLAVVLGIVALIAIGALLWANWGTIMDKAKAIWGKIKAFFSTIFNAIKTRFTETWNKIKNDLINQWEAISDFISKILQIIVGFFQDHWKKIIGILFPPVGLAMLIVKLWGPMKDKVKALLGAIVGFFKDNWKKILGILFPPFGLAMMVAKIWGPITGKIKDIWDGAVDVVKKAVNKIIDLINKVIDVWNDLEFKVGPLIIRVNLPGFKRTFKVGPFTMGTPDLPTIPHLATGGIVTGPTNALIGEAGPEAIIPLDRLNQFGGSMQEIIVMLDSEIIARAVGDRQVEQIRVKTGIRM